MEELSLGVIKGKEHLIREVTAQPTLLQAWESLTLK